MDDPVWEFIVVILQGFLEVIGLIALSLVFARADLRWKKVAVYALGFFVVVQLVRYLPFPFGFHSLVALLLLTIIVGRVGKLSLVTAFIASFAGILVLAGLELFFNALALALLKIPAEAVSSDRLLWALIGLPQALAMVLLAWGGAYLHAMKGKAKKNVISSIQ